MFPGSIGRQSGDCYRRRAAPWNRRGTAIKLAEEGANVVVSDICRTYEGDLEWYPLGGMEHLETVVERIEEIGLKCAPLKADITRKEEVEAMVNETLEKFGRLDILVNNAGWQSGRCRKVAAARL